MAEIKIRLTNSFGKILKFNAANIKSALVGRNAGIPEHWGEAHVWAADPTMVGIYKTRDKKRGPFYYEIAEIDENSLGKFVDIVYLRLEEDEVDEAIKIFVSLCKKPKKVLQRKLIKKMGGHAIFLNKIAAQSNTR